MTAFEAQEDPPTTGVLSVHFAALLRKLGEGEEAGGDYVALRARLVALFRHHFPVEAEAMADTTLDRLGRRIAEGVDIAEPRHYALGIARLVLQEGHKQAARHRKVPVDEQVLAMPEESEDGMQVEITHAALDRCLKGMDAGAAQLILDYYGSGETGEGLIPVRRRIAERLGLTANALRNRALRLRTALEDCVRSRLRQAK